MHLGAGGEGGVFRVYGLSTPVYGEIIAQRMGGRCDLHTRLFVSFIMYYLNSLFLLFEGRNHGMGLPEVGDVGVHK